MSSGFVWISETINEFTIFKQITSKSNFTGQNVFMLSSGFVWISEVFEH